MWVLTWTRTLLSIFAQDDVRSKNRPVENEKEVAAYCCSTSFSLAALPLSSRR
jgi:hypothetical protein